MRKIKFCGLPIVGLAYLMFSCLGGDTSVSDEWNLSNAQIASFSLSNDSIEGLSDVKFVIDQVNGKIYNRDSMPYGTVVDEKVICSIGFVIGSAGVLMVTQATNDSIYWNTGDSVDFSSPVMITVYAYDGVSTKTYEAKINIHQVNPDSMVWNLHSGLISGKSFKEIKVIPHGNVYYMYTSENEGYRLYRTEKANLSGWTEIPLSGFPAKAVLSGITEFDGALYACDTDGLLHHSADGENWSQLESAPYIKALLGSLPESGTGGEALLSAISQADETLRFAAMNKNGEWQTGNEAPASFPLSGFGTLNYEVMYHSYLTVAAGRDGNNNLSNSVWSTMNALSWTPLNGQAAFSKREGVAFYPYDGLLYIAGGIDESGTALNDVYYTKDRGVTWQQDTVHVMPAGDYEARGYSSVVVDEDHFVLLFGGKAGKNTNVLNELWRGRINRLGFKE